MRRIEHAVIMAAGRGRRMMPLTEVIPKPMAPYMNSTLIGEGIAKIKDHVRFVHVTVGYKAAMLSQHLIERGVSTIITTEGQNNAWWIFHSVLRYLREPLFVLTCDNITDIDFSLLAQNYSEVGEPACMLVPVTPVADVHGDYIFHDGGVVTELNRDRPSDIYCSGIQILHPQRVNELAPAQGDFYSVWRQLIGHKQLRVSSVYPKKWYSIDTIADLDRFRA